MSVVIWELVGGIAKTHDGNDNAKTQVLHFYLCFVMMPAVPHAFGAWSVRHTSIKSRPSQKFNF